MTLKLPSPTASSAALKRDIIDMPKPASSFNEIGVHPLREKSSPGTVIIVTTGQLSVTVCDDTCLANVLLFHPYRGNRSFLAFQRPNPGFGVDVGSTSIDKRVRKLELVLRQPHHEVTLKPSLHVPASQANDTIKTRCLSNKRLLTRQKSLSIALSVSPYSPKASTPHRVLSKYIEKIRWTHKLVVTRPAHPPDS